MGFCRNSWLVLGIGIAVLAGVGSTAAHGQSFSFAIIADPHIDGTADHLTKLQLAIDHIIANQATYNTHLVFVVGDIAWGGTNLSIAKAELDRLNDADIPYIPIVGDNEALTGYDEDFDITFAEQFLYLSLLLDNWQQAPTPVGDDYLENYSFDHGNCHFICADFASRTPGDEGGDLHDHTDGTWPWVKNDIQTCAKPKNENIILLTHIGMFRTGISTADQYLFDSTEMSKITTFLDPYRSNVAYNFAGHIHVNFTWNVKKNLFSPTIYTAQTTDETWYRTNFPETNDQQLTVRYVTATTGMSSMSYSQTVVDVPEP
jgi:hypothetical protein